MAGMDHSKMAEGGAGNSGMLAAMNTMMKNMESFKPEGNTDHDFAHMMMAHHQGAVEMSALELKEGKDATLRAMAEKISADQQKEIKDLEAIARRPLHQRHENFHGRHDEHGPAHRQRGC